MPFDEQMSGKKKCDKNKAYFNFACGRMNCHTLHMPSWPPEMAHMGLYVPPSRVAPAVSQLVLGRRPGPRPHTGICVLSVGAHHRRAFS